MTTVSTVVYCSSCTAVLQWTAFFSVDKKLSTNC